MQQAAVLAPVLQWPSMPQHCDYHDRVNLNIYDAFSPAPTPAGAASRVRLFGGANLGDHRKTNAFVAGTLSADQSALITDWHARTNLALEADAQLHQAFHAWASVTTVTLVIGTRLMAVAPLSILLGERSPLGIGGHPPSPDDTGEVRLATDILAEKIYDLRMSHVRSHRYQRYAELGDWDKDAWRAVADYIRPQFIPIPIGVRQGYYVEVDSDHRAAMALAEVTPPVSPQALVWIHLEGHLSRSVY